MTTPSRFRRAVIAVAGATLLTVGVAGAGVAAGGDGANPGSHAPDAAAATAAVPPGSELQLVAVAPCRIIDTRKSGGALVAASRVFDATMTNYSTQGGKAGTCNIPDVAVAIQLNLGAISQNNKTSDIKGWATSTTEPTASLVNYNPSGPVANMVTMPVNASGQFTLKTPGAAHVFADVAGYYVKPLYVTLRPEGTVYAGMASGFVSSSHPSTGVYTVTFDRNIRSCAATGSDVIFIGTRDISPDVTYNPDGNTVEVRVTNASNALEDTFFTLSLTC